MHSAEHEELWSAYRKDPGSVEHFERLVTAWMPLVQRVLRRLVVHLPPHVEHADLMQSAVMGLCHAIERFDPSRGAGFAPYATWRIRGAVLDELRKMDHVSRSGRALLRRMDGAVRDWTALHGRPPEEHELAAELEVSREDLAEALTNNLPWLSLDQAVVTSGGGGDVLLRDVLRDTDTLSPASQAEKSDWREILRRLYRKLSTREQQILYLYYFEDLTLAEIAALFEITEARVCQIHGLTVVKLRALLEHESVQAGRARSSARRESRAQSASVAAY